MGGRHQKTERVLLRFQNVVVQLFVFNGVLLQREISLYRVPNSAASDTSKWFNYHWQS